MLSRWKKRPVKNRVEGSEKPCYLYVHTSATRVTVFPFIFYACPPSRIKGGILFKLEMFSKRITICGGALRFEPLEIRDRVAE